MAKAKKSAATKDSGSTSGEARFPYSTKPSSLRRILQLIPKKPKPPKIDGQLLKSWGFTDSNDHSVIRVLKSLGLLGSANEPTDLYAQFMNLQTGAASLAPSVRKIYAPMFTASHEPYKESVDTLQNLFNIHSGGGERAIEQQIQTFKAICENVIFDATSPTSSGATAGAPDTVLRDNGGAAGSSGNGSPPIHINVHIHLPENKGRRDYEAMIEDIGKYIFGRVGGGGGGQP